MRPILKRILPAFLVFIFALVVFVPTFVFADNILDSALVPSCSQINAYGNNGVFEGACQLCDLATLANNLIRFGVAFSVVAAAIMFAYAGVLYFTAAGSEGNIKKAHGIFIKVFAGLIIILIAWLLVDLFMKTLTNQTELGPWSKFQCMNYPMGGSLDGHKSTTHLATTNIPDGGGGSGQPAPACTGCVGIDSSVKSETSHKAQPGLVSDITKFNQKTPGGIVVTDVGDRSGHAEVVCNAAGSCGDVVRADRKFTAENIRADLNNGKQIFSSIQFETNDPAKAQSLWNQGFDHTQVLYVPWASGDHYGVYCGAKNATTCSQ